MIGLDPVHQKPRAGPPATMRGSFQLPGAPLQQPQQKLFSGTIILRFHGRLHLPPRLPDRKSIFFYLTILCPICRLLGTPHFRTGWSTGSPPKGLSSKTLNADGFPVKRPPSSTMTLPPRPPTSREEDSRAAGGHGAAGFFSSAAPEASPPALLFSPVRAAPHPFGVFSPQSTAPGSSGGALGGQSQRDAHRRRQQQRIDSQHHHQPIPPSSSQSNTGEGHFVSSVGSMGGARSSTSSSSLWHGRQQQQLLLPQNQLQPHFSLELDGAEGGDVGEMHAMDDVPTAASPEFTGWPQQRRPSGGVATQTFQIAQQQQRQQQQQQQQQQQGANGSSPMPIAFPSKRPLAAASSFGTGSVSPLMESTLAKAAAAAAAAAAAKAAAGVGHMATGSSSGGQLFGGNYSNNGHDSGAAASGGRVSVDPFAAMALVREDEAAAALRDMSDGSSNNNNNNNNVLSASPGHEITNGGGAGAGAPADSFQRRSRLRASPRFFMSSTNSSSSSSSSAMSFGALPQLSGGPQGSVGGSNRSIGGLRRTNSKPWLALVPQERPMNPVATTLQVCVASARFYSRVAFFF